MSLLQRKDKFMKREFWDDLFVFLTVIRSGKLNEAAIVLKMSTPTISRRLDALESTLGNRLLYRGIRGCHPTNLGLKIIPMIEEMERLSDNISIITGQKDIYSINIVANDWLTFIIMRELKEYKKANYPINIKLTTKTFTESNERYQIELLNKEDVKDMISSQRIGCVKYGFYASIDYIQINYESIELKSWHELEFITMTHGAKDASTYSAWLKEFVKGEFKTGMQCNYFLSIYDAVISGLGIGIVEVTTGQQNNSLKRVFPEFEISEPIWTSIDKRTKNKELSRVIDFLKYVFT